MHKRNAIICNHEEQQQQQQKKQMPNGRWPYNNLPFMQSGSTAKGRWREREVGNRLQIVSLARFGCVLTCGGGGQGKARQGKARRICLPKQKAIKTTPSGSGGERRRAEQREGAVQGESSGGVEQ